MKLRALGLAVAVILPTAFLAPIFATKASTGCPPPPNAGRLTMSGAGLRGDVDGDGRADRVSVRYEPDAPGSCGIFLVARTSRGTEAARLPAYVVGEAKESIRLGLPRLVGVLQLSGGTAAQQVVVEVGRGAHAAFYAVYRIWRGRLRRMSIRNDAWRRFVWNAGLTNFGSVDCLNKAGLLSVGEYGAGTRYPQPGWNLETSAYRLVRLNFLREHATERIVNHQQLKKVQSEFSSAPFGNCVGAHAR